MASKSTLLDKGIKLLAIFLFLLMMGAHLFTFFNYYNNVALPVIPIVPVEENEANGLCHSNVYAPSLKSSLPEIAHKMDRWLDNAKSSETSLAEADRRLRGDKNKHMARRFEAFEEMSRCEKTCEGGDCSDDKSKQVCGLSLLKAPCIVYSIGGNNRWEFEQAILEKTECAVHTFDCTGPKTRFNKIPKNDRMHFHHVCLGPENKAANPNAKDREPHGEFWTMEKIQKTLGHNRIDLFKMDIEGYEWPIFDQWPLLTDAASKSTALPMQVLVEIHYSANKDAAFVELQSRLLKMGYATIINDMNPACARCVELTLMRIRC